jgi:hypothetical protein
MTDKQLQKIYQTACAGKNYEPSDGQFKVWKQTLGWIEEEDLAQALVDWFSNNSTFPMPAELKPLAMHAKDQRIARTSIKKYLVRWQCRECKITQCGWIPESDHEPRICRGIPQEAREGICNGYMDIIHDERPKAA